jgi:predicted permease
MATIIVVGFTVLAMLFSRGLPGASRSSIVQGSMRPNSYFGIAVSSIFFSPQTASLVMLALALCLPVVNVISIMALSWWSGSRPAPLKVAKVLASNPIILSTLAGVAASLSGLTLPLPIGNTLDLLGKSAVALGLVYVGSGLVFSREGFHPVALAFTSILKLLALPLLAAKVCLMLAVSAPVALAACFYCALPTAPNAYIMARQMGGDARLMASLITLQTLLAVLTVPASKDFLALLGA